MQNNQNNGYNQYQQFPTSSGNGWRRETEWSTPDESWRGKNDRKSPIPYDTWKQKSRDRPGDDRNDKNFEYGRDRAPANLDDGFLQKIGAKRQQNGNLIDSDGYTLRTRDPECSAPLPPKFNPRKDFQREKAKTPELSVLSQEDLDKKAAQQIKMMEKMKKEEERKKRRIEKEEEEIEGEDEYEDVETPQEVISQPPPVKIARKTSEYQVYPKTEKAKPESSQRSWYQSYQEHVENLKKQVYANLPKNQPTASTGYFFPSAPPIRSYSQSPSTSGLHSIKPPILPSPAPIKPPQMDLPPPGIIPDAFFQPRQNREIPPYQAPDLRNIDAFGVRIGEKPQADLSSDSEEEDEAVARLRAIIKNYGKSQS